MWVIKNKITDQFFAGWNGDVITTTDSKIYASHYPSWDSAMREVKVLTNNWIPILKEAALKKAELELRYH